MNNKIISSILLTLFVGIQGFAQEVSQKEAKQIKKEVAEVFEVNIKAGEKLDLEKISGSTDDSMQAGFIDNGTYFEAFDELMAGFARNVQGLSHQKMNVIKQKITVLSSNSALLTAHGTFEVQVTATGGSLEGAFAWTFIYKKINGEWKIIHSHMSNPG